MIISRKLSSKNQVTIPSLVRKKLKVKNGEQIIFIVDNDSVIIKKEIKDVNSFMSGLGKEIWEDPEKYIKNTRNEWEEKV
ncbi:type II toxin-antitoxin system PrlF family antitoxin [Patescibacteria group bacterium]|nr:type II toxin-antitoxin system PrlF family antitoxin [Patescibacteria group bacterium]